MYGKSIHCMVHTSGVTPARETGVCPVVRVTLGTVLYCVVRVAAVVRSRRSHWPRVPVPRWMLSGVPYGTGGTRECRTTWAHRM